MENERKAREQEEKDRVERMKKIKDQFADPNGQWEKDKTDIQNEAMKEKKEQEKTKEQQTLDDSKPAEGASSESKSSAAKPGESPAEVSCTSITVTSLVLMKVGAEAIMSIVMIGELRGLFPDTLLERVGLSL